MAEKPQLDVGKILKGLGYGYLFRNPFGLEYTKDPKNSYRTASDCYAKMLRWDPELAALDKLARLAVLSNDTELVAADDEKESDKAADFCREVLGDIDYWDDTLNALLNAPAQGLSVTQKGYVRDGRYIRIADTSEGAALQHLPLWWFYYKLSDDGRPALIYRGTYGGQKEQELDPELFIIARYNYDIENPYGVGYLQEAFWTFVKKNLLDGFIIQLCQRGVEVERWAQCLGIDAGGEEAWDKKDDINHALEHMQRRTTATFPPGVEIHHQAGDSAALASELNLAARYDNYHAKIILGQTLTTDTGRVGSYELGKIHELQQARLTVARCKKLMQWVNDQLITPLCELNFNIGRAKWKIKYEPEQDLDALAERLVKLGKVVKGLKTTRDFIHFTFDIPEVEEGEGGAPEEEYYELGGGKGGENPFESEPPEQFKLTGIEKKKTRIQDKADAREKELEKQVSHQVALNQRVVKRRLKSYEKLINKSKSFIDLQNRLAKRTKEWPEFADGLRTAVVTTYALRFVYADLELAGKKAKGFDDYDEVIAAFGDKIPIDAETFYNLDLELRAKYFATAVAEDEYMASIIQRHMTSSLESGRLFSDFKQGIYKDLMKAGYEYPVPYRLKTVFRYHQGVADAAAREDFYADPEVDAMLWGFEYLTAGDKNVRPEHASQHGTRLPKESPFWATNSPPLDFMCRCNKVMIMKDDAANPKDAPEGWQEIPNRKYGFDKDPREMLRAMPA